MACMSKLQELNSSVIVKVAFEMTFFFINGIVLNCMTGGRFDFRTSIPFWFFRGSIR